MLIPAWMIAFSPNELMVLNVDRNIAWWACVLDLESDSLRFTTFCLVIWGLLNSLCLSGHQYNGNYNGLYLIFYEY